MSVLTLSAAQALALAAEILEEVKKLHEEYAVHVSKSSGLLGSEPVYLQVEPDGQGELRLELSTASGKLSIAFTTTATVQLAFELLFGLPALKASEFSQSKSAPVAEPVEQAWKPGDPCASCGSTATYWSPVEGASCSGCGRSDSDE